MKPLRSARRTWLVVAVILALALVLTQLTIAGASGPPPQFPDPDNVKYYLVSTDTAGSVGDACVGGSLSFEKGDVIAYEVENACWLLWFGALQSDLTTNHDVSAVHDNCSLDPPFDFDPGDPGCDIFLSFHQNSIMVSDLGVVKGQDIVTAEWLGFDQAYGNYSLYFDGSDVDLTTVSEKIDGLYIFDPDEIPEDFDFCSHLLLISTLGEYRVPDEFDTNIRGAGEDVLAFCATNIGADTAGFWFEYFDGSENDMPKNQITAITKEENAFAAFFEDFDFTTRTAVVLESPAPTVVAGHSEVVSFFVPDYLGPFFSFPDDAGLSNRVDALHIYYDTDGSTPP